MTTVNAAFGGVMETKIRAVREAEQTVARVSARGACRYSVVFLSPG